MVQRTASGIRYDTKVKTSTSSKPMPTPTKSKGSGSDKLAAYKEATQQTTQGETPEQYRQKVEAQKQASKPSTDVSPMAQAGAQATPQISQQQLPSGILQGSDPKTGEQYRKLQGIPEPFSELSPTERITTAPGPRAAYEMTHRGSSIVEGVVPTGFAQYALDKSIELSGKIRDTSQKYQQTRQYDVDLSPVGIGKATIPYAAESLARMVDLTGMSIAGADVIRQKPEVAPLAFGAAVAIMPGAMAQEAKEDPIQFISDTVAFSVIGSAGPKAISGIKGKVRYIGKTQVPVAELASPDVVAGKAVFPVAQRGTPIPEVIKTFKETKYKYPGEVVPSREYGIHVSGIELPTQPISGKIKTIAGTSEAPGLYVGPDASLYFTGIKQSPRVQFTLFGTGTPPAQPSISFVGMKGIQRLPSELRADTAGARQFMLKTAPKETGFTTVKMEQGLKFGARERELVIPPESVFKKVETKYYTVYEGKKIPISRFEPYAPSTNTVAGTKRIFGIFDTKTTKASDLSSYYTPVRKYPIITPYRLSGIAGSSIRRPISSRKTYADIYSKSGIYSSERKTITPYSSIGRGIISSESARTSVISDPGAIVSSPYSSASYSTVRSSVYSSSSPTKPYTSLLPKPPIEMPKFKKKEDKNTSRRRGALKEAKLTELVNPLKGFKDVFGFR